MSRFWRSAPAPRSTARAAPPPTAIDRGAAFAGPERRWVARLAIRRRSRRRHPRPSMARRTEISRIWATRRRRWRSARCAARRSARGDVIEGVAEIEECARREAIAYWSARSARRGGGPRRDTRSARRSRAAVRTVDGGERSPSSPRPRPARRPQRGGELGSGPRGRRRRGRVRRLGRHIHAIDQIEDRLDQSRRTIPDHTASCSKRVWSRSDRRGGRTAGGLDGGEEMLVDRERRHLVLDQGRQQRGAAGHGATDHFASGRGFTSGAGYSPGWPLRASVSSAPAAPRLSISAASSDSSSATPTDLRIARAAPRRRTWPGRRPPPS